MRKKNVLFLSFMVLVCGCSSTRQSDDEIPCIDTRKNYPEKEIVLTDIAEVTYVHLDAKNEDYLYKGGICDITENTIVVQDIVSGSVLFFAKDGTPKSRFNRLGNGPDEYLDSRSEIAYDEAVDDVFITTPRSHCIQVYSSKGEYKRKLLLPAGVVPDLMGCFDNQSLIVFELSRIRNKLQPKTPEDNMDYLSHSIDSSFFLISKADGQVSYIPMSVPENDVSFKASKGNPMFLLFTNIVKHAEGFLLCNPETDTVFLFSKNNELTPIMRKIPLVDKSEPKLVLNNCLDVDRYQFMEVQTVGYEYFGANVRNKYYMRDKKTGEVFLQKVILPDYKDKKIVIHPGRNRFFHENGTHIELDLMELKLAYRENRLSGKLKELVASLNESADNNVFVIIRFTP